MKNKKYNFRIKLQVTVKSKETNEFKCLYFDDENEADSMFDKSVIFISKRWIIQVLTKKFFFFKKWIEVRQLVNNLSIVDINLRSKVDAEILLKYYKKDLIVFTGYYFLTHANSKLTKVEELIYKEFDERNGIIFVPNSLCRFIYKGKTYIGRTLLSDNTYNKSSKEIHYLCYDGSTGVFNFVANILYFDEFKYLKGFIFHKD